MEIDKLHIWIQILMVHVRISYMIKNSTFENY